MQDTNPKPYSGEPLEESRFDNVQRKKAMTPHGEGLFSDFSSFAFLE